VLSIAAGGRSACRRSVEHWTPYVSFLELIKEKTPGTDQEVIPGVEFVWVKPVETEVPFGPGRNGCCGGRFLRKPASWGTLEVSLSAWVIWITVVHGSG
jgi:hypothetical protein